MGDLVARCRASGHQRGGVYVVVKRRSDDCGHDVPVLENPRNRVMTVGYYVTMTGGLLLATTYVVTPPAAVPILGAVLFVGGLLLIAMGGGLRSLWRAFWSLFP